MKHNPPHHEDEICNIDDIVVFGREPEQVEYLLFLDDSRLPWGDRPKIVVPDYIKESSVPFWEMYAGPDTWDELAYDSVVWVHDYFEFRNALAKFGCPFKISFDHDLGQDKDGLDCAKWLEYFECFPKEYDVHSANPVGRDRIKSWMENFRDHRTSP